MVVKANYSTVVEPKCSNEVRRLASSVVMEKRARRHHGRYTAQLERQLYRAASTRLTERRR